MAISRTVDIAKPVRGANRYFAASTRLIPAIAGKEPVWTGRRQRSARGGVGEADLHFADEAVERIDTRRHLGDRGKLGAAGGGWLAGKLERRPVGIAGHQRRVFLAEPNQADRVFGERISDTARITSPFSTAFSGLKSRQRSA